MEKKKSNNLTKDEIITKYGTKGTDDIVVDLSRIVPKDLEQLLPSIVKLGKNSLERITFTIDLYRESNPKEYGSETLAAPKKKGQKQPYILQNSAYIKNPKALRSVLLALSHILPKTESLTYLGFRSIQFTQEQINDLVNYIKECNTLQELSFEYTPLYDHGFRMILSTLKRQGIKSFHCAYCGITDASVQDLKALLNYHVSIQREAEWRASLEIGGIVQTLCLSELDLRGNLFTYSALKELSDVLCDIPMTTLDMRENDFTDSRQVRDLQKNFPHVEVLINPSETEIPDTPSPRKSPTKTPSKKSRSPSAIKNKTRSPSASSKSTSASDSNSPSTKSKQRKASSSSLSKGSSRIDMYPAEYVNEPEYPYEIQPDQYPPDEQHYYEEPYLEYTPDEPKEEDRIVFPKPFQFDGPSDGEVEEIYLAPDLKVVGRRAREFASYIQTLADLLNKLHNDGGVEENALKSRSPNKSPQPKMGSPIKMRKRSSSVKKGKK